MSSLVHLVARARGGDRGALARAITAVESRHPESLAALLSFTPRRLGAPGSPHVVGVTGPPGAGKSSFVDRLVTRARSAGERVAVMAVDPSSPRTGGAILGDRIRLEDHADDEGVYIRSLSARGSPGGLCRAAGQVVDLFDGCGFDRVLVETVGVGQGELAVLEVADTVLVVLTPESGDTVQTMKAGLLEVADLFVVNKADRPGADFLVRDLELSVHLDARPGWQAPVHRASAARDEGVEAVLTSIEAHRAWIGGEGRRSWEGRRAEGRVNACLDRVAEESRAAAAARLRRSPLLPELRSGRLRPEQVDP